MGAQPVDQLLAGPFCYQRIYWCLCNLHGCSKRTAGTRSDVQAIIGHSKSKGTVLLLCCPYLCLRVRWPPGLQGWTGHGSPLPNTVEASAWGQCFRLRSQKLLTSSRDPQAIEELGNLPKQAGTYRVLIKSRAPSCRPVAALEPFTVKLHSSFNTRQALLRSTLSAGSRRLSSSPLTAQCGSMHAAFECCASQKVAVEGDLTSISTCLV